MDDTYDNFGIVVLPPRDIWDWLVSLSRRINEKTANPEVQLGNTQKPHLSLMHSYTSPDDRERVYAAIGDVLSTFRPFSLISKDICVEELGGTQWISVNVERSPELQAVHIKVSDELIRFEKKERKSREFAYENYRPHFTLAVNAGSVELKIEPRTFAADRIVACRLGDAFSTCDEILREWKLI